MDGDLSMIMERAANETILECDRFGDCFESDHVPFWLTKTGQIIRWSVFWGLFIIFMLWIIIGYWHAKRRLRKGLKPLAYHRWMLNRRQRAQAIWHALYAPSNLRSSAPMPPTYQPPAGATKADPSQWRSQPTRRPADDGGESAPNYEALPAPSKSSNK
ncbi:hypothetical protein DID88_008714 [Monilinia fructigena]|uniref:Uncharacterized protein n=1 Tax=Monilinia fructigena TaxID=38457 RepID=A0A395J6B1_9HELO|nr:hypothetical protein DID88_008714 [Monilinia fructigena]